MARKPNYSFERHERDRAKAAKLAVKGEAKRELRERKRALSDDPAPDAAIDGASPTSPDRGEV
jgi:hypothetical protein